MTQPNEAPRQARTDADRRGNDRRNVERRAPLPPWRRPWAYAGYGVAGALVLVLLLNGLGGDDTPPPSNDTPLVTREPGSPAVTPPVETPAPPASNAPVQEAYGAAGFEQLMLEGARAVGRVVKAELFCEQPSSYQVRTDVQAEAPVAALTSNGRIPAAACKWGGANDPRREDFLLLVPANMAADFAAAPVTSDDFQRRRRVIANVEWIGRSEALALRTAGVFRGFAR